jgi:uncharacterized repeat protein (TIGR01451 family)
VPSVATAQTSDGILEIQKVAPDGTTQQFDFTINPGGIARSIVGNGSTQLTQPAGNNYSITETVPPNWELGFADCRIFGEVQAGNWTFGTSTITEIRVDAGQTTRCTFFDDPVAVLVDKTNDANGDGTFNDTEAVPGAATFPRVVTYRLVLTKQTQASARITSITDDQVPAPLRTAGAGTDCADLIDTLIPDAGVTCFYDASFAATGPAQVVNTATVNSLIGSEVDSTDNDTSVVNFSPSLTITKSASAQAVPAGSPLSFTMTVGNTGRASTGAVTLTDALPAGLDWTVSPANPGCAINGGTLTCNLGVLGSGGTATVGVTATTTRAACGPVSNTASATADGATVTANATSAVQCFGVTIDKAGQPVAHHGESLPYTFAVANAGGIGLDNVVVTDDRCTVGAAPATKANDDGDNLLEAQGSNGTTSEVWTYTCTGSVPAHTAGENPLHNSATVNASASGQPTTATDTFDTTIIHPAVDIKIAGPATATAGDVLRYTLTVTNPGDVQLVGETLAVTDAGCDAPPALSGKGGDATPDFLNPGDTWTYTCSHATTARRKRQAGPVTNTATVVGTDPLSVSVTDSDTVTTDVAAAQTPPPDEDPPPVVDPDVEENTPPGRASLRGPARCVKGAFAVRFAGRQIRRVTIRIDGKKVKTFRRPGKAFRYRVRPRAYSSGLHRLKAKVRFSRASETKARTLRMAFQQCEKPVIAPTFTG